MFGTVSFILSTMLRGSFEKSVQSPRVDATGACRGSLQLVVSLGINHNKFQPDRSISLCLDEREFRVLMKH